MGQKPNGDWVNCQSLFSRGRMHLVRDRTIYMGLRGCVFCTKNPSSSPGIHEEILYLGESRQEFSQPFVDPEVVHPVGDFIRERTANKSKLNLRIMLR